MELQQLRYFLATAETGNVNHAAQRLHVSPSSVSRAIARLEHELDLELFTREGRGVRLNRFGERLAQTSAAAAASLDRSLADVREAAGRTSGKVAIGFLTSLGAREVPELVSAHRASHPHVTYVLRQRSAREAVAELLSGRTDLLLSVPGMFDHGDDAISWQPLFTERLVMVLPHTHRLAARATVGIDEFREEEFVTMAADHTVRILFDRACHQAGVIPNIIFEGTDVFTLRGLIRAGIGVGLLPEAADEKGLVGVPTREDVTRSIALGVVPHRFLSPAAAAFRDTALRHSGSRRRFPKTPRAPRSPAGRNGA